MKRSVWLGLGLAMLWTGGAWAQAPKDKKDKDKKPAAAAAATPAPTPTPEPKKDYTALLNTMRFRELGPATMGGRVNDIAVVESDPRIIYAATASGGIFKSTNGGTTWAPVFDNEAVSTIGDMAIAPSDPMVIYAGTGEANNRQSSSWGNGVYKSIDAGKTWKHIGLTETHHIGRIVIHPTNPDVAYVAAAGKLWGASKERGVYKTTDGGKTWQHSLYINDDTGVEDIAIDWESPNVLYAGAYQRRRTVFGFNGSGAGSGLYRTMDGGATWAKVTRGMPYDLAEGATPGAAQKEIGRVAVDVYRRNTNIVYATVENVNGGVYRSEDKGETWTKMSDTQPRPMYFSKIRIDPNNDLRIWMAGVNLHFSEDGGKTWSQQRGNSVHSDWHGIWIDPKNSDHAIVGTDGGIYQTWDQGRTWDHHNQIPLGQFYEVGVDMRQPYYICGGLQDNNTWCGPSKTLTGRGPTNEDWFTVGGGDGFYALMDPTDHRIVYAESQDGNLLRRNIETGESRSIRPQPDFGEAPFRFQWNSPIVISAYDPKTIYYAGNFVFKSNNQGDIWKKISPDLTTGADRNTMPIMGKVPDRDTRSRHDGVQNFPTITTISESPVSANTLWAGTDDGNLQVTRDGGANWKNVADKTGAPKGTYVSRVVASKAGEGAAIVTLDGHRNGDFKQYIYLTNDWGETWKSLAGTLPQDNGALNVVREHPRNPNLLFLGGEYGAFMSWDRGANWTKIKMNLPTVPVDDIVIHPRDNDLIFGTHGRSIWILDDITGLEQMNEQVMASDVHLFDPRPGTMWRQWNNDGGFGGEKRYVANNPQNGAYLNFYFKNKPGDSDRVTITIADDKGQTVRAINCQTPRNLPQVALPPGIPANIPPAILAQFGLGGGGQCRLQQGFNRFVWDFRANPLTPGGGGGRGQGGGGFGGGGGQGLRVEPGQYTVKIAYGQKEMSKSITVYEDPRIQLTPEQRAARRDAITKLRMLGTQAQQSTTTLVGLRATVNNALESWRRPAGPGGPQIPENIRKAAEDLLKRIDEIYPNFANPPGDANPASQAGPPLVQRGPTLPQRVNQLAQQIDGYSSPLNQYQIDLIPALQQKVTEASAGIPKLREDFNALNKMMNEAGIPHLTIQQGGQQVFRPFEDEDGPDRR
jgi:photosystem II stability/assembly factor-like uncharacterized protein